MIPKEKFPKHWLWMCEKYHTNGAEIGIMLDWFYDNTDKTILTIEECSDIIEYALSHEISFIDSARKHIFDNTDIYVLGKRMDIVPLEYNDDKNKN
jgi:hypothetical protein